MTNPALAHLTGGQLHAYTALNSLPQPANAAAIAAAANFSASYTTRVLGELVAEGLITVTKDPADVRRVRKLWSIPA